MALARVGAGKPVVDGAAAAALPPLPPIKLPRTSVAAKAKETGGAAAKEAEAAEAAEAEAPEAAAEMAAVSSAAAGGPLMEYVLRRTLRQHLCDWTPLVRQAAAAWLLSILNEAGSHPAVRRAANDIQEGLLARLADSNETTQELAAKALSKLFEACDEASRKRILAELVKGLTASRKQGYHASGGDMSTYEELQQVANDAGQPELVYKLMELSTASAVWNTRKGVAIALRESGGTEAAAALDEEMEKLVPVLYRYTFNPISAACIPTARIPAHTPSLLPGTPSTPTRGSRRR